MMPRLQCYGPKMWARPSGLATALAFTVLLGGAAQPSNAQGVSASGSKTTDILGRWLTEPGDGIIEITRIADGSYQGTIIGGKTPHRVDEHNPNPGQRQALLLGQVILKDMHEDGDGTLAGGTIYEPDTGRTYRCRMELLDHDRLKVRGFIGVSLLGRSQTWTRFTGLKLDLSTPAH
jgi:uncharacterized protein (DUF2147 family)